MSDFRRIGAAAQAYVAEFELPPFEIENSFECFCAGSNQYKN